MVLLNRYKRKHGTALASQRFTTFRMDQAECYCVRCTMAVASSAYYEEYTTCIVKQWTVIGTK